MAAFPQGLVTRIKSAANLVDLVSEHVVLKKSGTHWTGLCPFHGERTPSFSVSEAKQLYHCYGCQAGGDAIHFIQEIFGLSFQDAIAELAERYKVDTPELQQSSKHSSGENGRNQMAHKLNRFAAAFFRQNYQSHTVAQEYVRQRGLNLETEKNFYVGYAFSDWQKLAEKLKVSKAPMPLAAELGLIRPSQKNVDGYFDLFRDRVIFPILDARGKIQGFGGRALSESPKYLNSSDSFLFHKQKVLFGLYQAKRFIRESNEAIVVEGFFDVAAMAQAGIQNTVATCGTALSLEHLDILGRFADRILLLFDGDAAGQKAMLRGMELGLEQGKILHGAVLPEGLDPADLCGQGRVAFLKELVSNAKPLVDAEIERRHQEWTQLSDPALRSEFLSQSLKQVFGWLDKYKDQVGKEVRLKRIHELFGIRPPGAKPVARPTPPRPVQAAPKKRGPVTQPSKIELQLLWGLTHWEESKEDWTEFRSRLPSDTVPRDLFTHPALREWTEKVFQGRTWELGPDLVIGQNAFHDDGSDLLEFKSLIFNYFMESTTDVRLADFRGALKTALHQVWARISQQVLGGMKEAEARQDRIVLSQKSQEYLDVQRKIEELRTFNDQSKEDR